VPVVSRADVIVDKSASPSPVFAGETLTYSIVVSNAGPSEAQSVVLTDVLPLELTLLTCDASGASCVTAGNSITVEWPSLALNAQQRITLTAIVSSEVLAGASLTNTAFVTSTTPDPNAGNNDDDAITPVVARADLSIVKTASPASVVAGETLTYTLVVSNAGPSVARPVTITDQLPAEVVFASCDSACTTSSTGSGGNAVTITFPSLAVGEVQTITIATTVSAGVPSGTIITNTATITSSTPDDNLINNTDDVTTPVTTRADLGIIKSAVPATVLAGERVTYTLLISNAGPSVAQPVTVTDTLPPQVTFVSCDSACTHTSNTITVTYPSLAVGEVQTITLVVTVNANVLSGTIIANTAAVTSTTPDPNPIDNTDDATTTVQALADLGIVKTAAPEPVVAGETLTYTLVYSNAGPSDAQATRIIDTLPAGVTFGGVVNATPVLPAPSVSGSTVVFDLGTLAAGANGSIVITATVTGNAATAITNTAQIGSITPDPDPGNNEDDAGTTVWFADVAIAKSVEPTRPVVAGEWLTYTLVFTNLGNAPAQNVFVSDAVPAGLTWNGGYIATPPASVASNGQQLAWTIGTLQAGASGSIAFTVTVNGDNDALVHYVNNASIGTTTPQTDTTNDNAQTTSSRLLLDVQKTASINTVVVGQPISYTLRISNIGDATIITVPVTDTYDAAFLQFVSASIAPSTTAPGLLAWGNIGPINAGESVNIVVTFTALTTTFGLSTTNTVTATGAIPEVSLPPITDTEDVQVLAPALAVAKLSAFDGAELRPGNRLTYTLVIRNSGDATATGVVVSDTLPAFTTFVPNSIVNNPPGGTTGTPPILASNLVVPAGGVVTVTYAVTASLPLTDGVQIVNTVAVSSTEVPTQVTSTVTDTVASSHVLAVEKTASAQIVAPGDTLTYTLRYTVTGDGPVEALRLFDSLPAALSYVNSLPPAASVIGQDVSWDLGNVLTATEGITQATGSVLLVARVSSPLPDGLVVTNTVSLSDRSEQRVEDEMSITIAATHTLEIVKRAVPTLVLPGSLITYTLIYTIAGNEPVINVVVRDTTPANTTFVLGNPTPTSAPVPGGTGEVQWAIGNVLLASSGITQVTGVVTLVVQANATVPADLTTITNTVSIEDDSGLLVTSTVTQGVPADMAVVKTVTPSLVLVGGLVTYTLVVSNNGPGLAQNVLVTDVLPAGMAFISASGNPINTNPLIWQLGNLLAGQAVELQVVAMAPANTGTVTNTAQVGTTSPETRTDNNNALVPVLVGRPLLQIAKTVNQGNGSVIKPEDLLTYTMVVSNMGNLPATNVLVVDNVPEQTSYVEGSATPPAAMNGKTLTWAVGRLMPAQTFTFSFAVRVTAQVNVQQSIRNVALVSSQELTDTNSNEVINILPPTAIQLASFTAKRVATNTVQIDWVTQSEVETFAFNLLRSTNKDGLDAVYLTDRNDPVRARGGNVLASYAFTDTAAPAGVLYYWLEETELDGSVLLYGPFPLTDAQTDTPSTPPVGPATYKIFTPIVTRR
jgi:uncharacterized repeat protein (TIGR01451 family)